jgi:hypothetical protein
MCLHGHSEMIVIDPEVRRGKPCIAGTRMTVGDVLEYLDHFPVAGLFLTGLAVAFSLGENAHKAILSSYTFREMLDPETSHLSELGACPTDETIWNSCRKE